MFLLENSLIAENLFKGSLKENYSIIILFSCIICNLWDVGKVKYIFKEPTQRGFMQKELFAATYEKQETIITVRTK